jgi:aryl-alcohol dehydrogenase-like predicted oxidoreductase
MMQKTTLGQTQIEVSALGIGAWAWGDPLFWNYGQNFGETEVKEAFETAVNAGITFFDTAEVYGNGESERLLAKFSQQSSTPITIATKYAQFPWRWSKKAVKNAIKDSLERLQIKQIPLYQVHWPFSFFMTQERLMNALADEVEQGTILSIGVSNYSAVEMELAHNLLAKRGIPLAVNQVKYSLLFRRVETKGITAKAKELGVTILAYSPLAQGLLTGKYNPQKNLLPDGVRKRDFRFQQKGLIKILPLLNLLVELSNKYQKTPAQISLNWLIAQGNVIPIPGAKNAKQSLENAGALGWQLLREDVANLELMSRTWL